MGAFHDCCLFLGCQQLTQVNQSAHHKILIEKEILTEGSTIIRETSPTQRTFIDISSTLSPAMVVEVYYFSYIVITPGTNVFVNMHEHIPYERDENQVRGGMYRSVWPRL